MGSLGIEPGPIASQLLDEERARPPWRTSSLTSPWSTFLGVLGDLGVIGLLSYLSLWIWLAMHLGKKQIGRPGVVLICFLLVIGLFYNWLEEPVLTLFLALPLAHSLMQVEASDTRLARQ